LFRNIPGSFAEKVLCSISEPALIYDENRDICWVNPAAEIFFGHSSQYLHGMKCNQIFNTRVECMDRCPVNLAFQTGKDQLLAVDTLDTEGRLIEAIPCGKEDNSFVLAIIHSPPEKDRHRALRRDLAASLNSCTTLVEASSQILGAAEKLVYLNRVGIYLGSGDDLILSTGRDVPTVLPGVLQIVPEGPVFLNSDDLPAKQAIEFPAGLTLMPIAKLNGVSSGVYILAGRVCWGSESRGMLELISGVLSECIERLTSGAFSTL